MEPKCSKSHLKLLVKETVFRKWARHFATVFGVPLERFYDAASGFSMVRFEEFVMQQRKNHRPSDVDSFYNLVMDVYGHDGATVVEHIINEELKGLYAHI